MTTRRPVLRHRADRGGTVDGRADTLAVEEPLEIRLGRDGEEAEPFTVTMRTPGHDLDLALGFLVGEGVLRASSDVVSARHCPDAAVDADGRATHNVVEVILAGHVAAPPRGLARQVGSACGVCGVESIEQVRARSPVGVGEDEVRLDAAVVASLPTHLRGGQRAFARTGGVHAAGLFRADGTLICLREDVGRHNALDKVIGWALQSGMLPLHGTAVQVSGRASFELVQKAATAGCPVLAAVSAPSSLAVDLATDLGLTLIAFSREAGFNVYAGSDRIVWR